MRLYVMCATVAFALAVTSCNRSPTSPTNNGCVSTPNYVSSVTLHRFSRFPVSASINIDRNVVSATWLPRYRDAISQGVQLWAQVTAGRAGQTDISFDNPSAPIQITLVAVAPDDVASGRAFFVNGGTISSARVELYRTFLSGSGFGGLERLVDAGTWPEDMMTTGGNGRREGAPLTWFTTADKNTMIAAYCE